MDEFEKIKHELQASRHLADPVASILEFPIKAAGKTASALYTEQPAFFSGYLVGLADVLSQAAGGDPGGNLSQNLALRLMVNLLGQKGAEVNWKILIWFMRSSSPEFEEGMKAGGEDGNRIGEKGLPLRLAKQLGL